ncbi:PatB family C-S lyase [Candidatus Bathyarchaeota archaeon]|nr:PatB family C-S lyase [Candidatus Bathyarchaeota archaeon]
MKYNFDEIIDRIPTSSSKWSFVKRRHGDEDILPLWVADMDFACPPEVVEAIQKRALHPIYGYSSMSDNYPEALIKWMKKRNCWDIKREWLCFTPGVVTAINISVLAYTHPGDKIVIQSPVYYPFASAVLNNGRQLVENKLKIENGRYVMDYEDLEKKIDARTKMIVLCSPHNPVGRVWERSELEKLVDVCDRKDIIICSDEIHSDLILGKIPHTCVASLGEKAAKRTVTLTAPSKTFNLAGLKDSNIIIPDKKLRDAFTINSSRISLGANVFGLVACEAAYSYGEPWLEELLTYLRGNLKTLEDYIADKLPELKVYPCEGTYLPWIDCSQLCMNDDQLRDFFLKNAKLWLDEGRMFGSGGSGFMRINIACPKSLLLKALDRLEKAVKECRSQNK